MYIIVVPYLILEPPQGTTLQPYNDTILLDAYDVSFQERASKKFHETHKVWIHRVYLSLNVEN